MTYVCCWLWVQGVHQILATETHTAKALQSVSRIGVVYARAVVIASLITTAQGVCASRGRAMVILVLPIENA